MPYITAYLTPITYAVLVLALLFAAGRIAVQQRGEDAREVGYSLLKFVLVTGLGASLVHLGTVAGDMFAKWILDAATHGVEGKTLGFRMLDFSGGLTGPILMFLFILVILAGLVQLVLVYARAVVLVLLVGLLPVAAAAGITRTGKAMLDKYLAWVAAWILWKPVAAIVYAAAFWLIGTGEAKSSIAGLVALAMSVFALPALMRLLVPATSAISGAGGGGGGVAATGVMAAGALRGVGQLGGPGGGTGSMSVRDATHSNTPSGAEQAAPSGQGAAAAGKAPTPAPAAAGPAGAGVAAAAGGVQAAAQGAKQASESAIGQPGGDS